SLHKRLLGLIVRVWRDPFQTAIDLLSRHEWTGTVVWVYRLWIKCRPDDPQKYYYLSSALRRRDRLSKAVQAFADGMVVQQRLAAKTGAPADVRYLGESWTHAIGHIALLDVIAKRQLLGLAPTHHVILARGKVANSPYLDLWRRHFEIVSDAIQ